MAEGIGAARPATASGVSQAAWLDAAAARSFAHCGDFAAAWLREGWGVPADGRADLTLKGWARVLHAAGGLEAVAETEAAALGLKAASAPAAGQVALAPVPASNGRTRLACAVIAPSLRCAVWSDSGLLLISAAPRRTWEV